MAGKTEHPKDEAFEPQTGETPDEGMGEMADTADDDLAEEMQLAEDAAKSGFASPMAFLSAQLDQAENDKAELKENYLRAHAEMENLRRRTQRDVADAREYSIAGFAREMLSVADNLRRALEAFPLEAREAGDSAINAFIEGVEVTERSMMQALEKHGVKKITPLDEKFDPNLHQAMFEIPNTDVPNNTVLQVVQDGFVIGNRCLRPAMVGVSKGGPKGEANPATEEKSEA
jgi:molecular chaperone GrpE